MGEKTMPISYKAQQQCMQLTSFFKDKKEALLDLLMDQHWHSNVELPKVAGKRYGARIWELRQDGYIIDRQKFNNVDHYQMIGKKWVKGGEKRMEFEEIKGEVKEMKAEGDSIEGVLINKEENVGVNKSCLYHFEKEGKTFAIWGSTVLDSRMIYVKVGEYLRITHKGTQESKKGLNPVKIFKVERAKKESS